MAFIRAGGAIRGWRSRPLVNAVVVSLALGAVGGGWWALTDARRSPDQRIIDAGRYAGTHRTAPHILEVADNVCASLRQDHSLGAAHGLAGRQLLLEGTDPTRWLVFIHAVIDNRCPDADDHLLGDD